VLTIVIFLYIGMKNFKMLSWSVSRFKL